MPRIEFLTSDLSDVLRDAEFPEEIKEMMLKAMGETAKEYVISKGNAYGIRSEEREGNKHLLDKVKVSKPKLNNNGGYIDVYFSGKEENGVKNGYVAFLQNYGTRDIKARPFVSDVASQYGEQILQAGESIYNHYKGDK